MILQILPLTSSDTYSAPSGPTATPTGRWGASVALAGGSAPAKPRREFFTSASGCALHPIWHPGYSLAVGARSDRSVVAVHERAVLRSVCRLQWGVVTGSRRVVGRVRRDQRAAALVAAAAQSLDQCPLATHWAWSALGFGVPCPTTSFTAGLLMLAMPRSRGLSIIPVSWCVIGGSAAFLLGVRADYALPIAGIAMAIYWMQRSTNARTVEPAANATRLNNSWQGPDLVV